MPGNDEKAGCLLGFLAKLFGSASKTDNSPQVSLSKKFPSQAELAFFRVLRQALGDRGHILYQVSLQQLLFFPGNNQNTPNRTSWSNKVRARSIDFLIVDNQTLSPRVAIELDDSSHNRSDRATRDDEVNLLLKTAGLPIVRIRVTSSYETKDLQRLLSEYLR